MKTKIQVVTSPENNMPESVKHSCAQVWAENYTRVKTGNAIIGVELLPKNISDICYTYGAMCFSPRALTRDLLVHESVHTTQQGENPDAWWDRYGQDKAFRYSQELEAYRAQYTYLIATKGKAQAFKHAQAFARDMASPMYGTMCTEAQALQDILRP